MLRLQIVSVMYNEVTDMDWFAVEDNTWILVNAQKSRNGSNFENN